MKITKYKCDTCSNGVVLRLEEPYSLQVTKCSECRKWVGLKGTTKLDPIIEGWQPIETAPKDGTEVLIYYRDGGVFITEDTDFGSYHVSNPTHWQPLPKPPIA